MRKPIMIAVLLAVVLALPVMAGDLNAYKVDPNDKVMYTLLSMVVNDLEMCRTALRSNYVDNVLAVGHLNNAQSALKRTDLDPAYTPLVSEILDRIGKIKFYLVMRDLENVNMRLNQLIAVIRSMTGGTGALPIPGGYPGYNGGYNGGGFYPGNTGGYTPRPTERPVGSVGGSGSGGGAQGSVGIPMGN